MKRYCQIIEIGEELDDCEMSHLIHLEEIDIENSNRLVSNIEAMANNLKKLERIHFPYASFDDILPLISRAENIRKIKIKHLQSVSR